MQILRDILSLTGVREHIGRMREALEDDRAALDGVGDAPERDEHVERFVGEGIRVRVICSLVEHLVQRIR
jgi:hypothetical protein